MASAARMELAAQAVSKAARGPALCQQAGEPGQSQGQDIAQVVAGIGDQGHGIGHQAINYLDDDEGRIEDDADGEGTSVAGRCMDVVPVTAGVLMIVVMVRSVVVIAVFVVMCHG